MIYLRQSTASQSVLIGPFIDDTDGKTAETGLTIANTDIRVSKNGGNMAAKNSGGGTHDEAGWYTITLDATDTNTVGRLQVSVHVSGALPVWMEFQVLEEAIYDALFAASAAGYSTLDAAGIRTAVGLGSANLDSQLADIPTVAEMNARTLAAADYFDPSADTVANVTAVGSVSGSVGSVTGSVGGNVVGSVGSISGVTFPTNFGDLAITVTTGRVTVGTNEDKAGYSLTPTTGLGNQTADITGSLSGSVGSVTGAVGSVTGNVGGNVVGSVGSVLGGINTAAGTIQTLDALDTAQDSQHATTQAAVADVPTVAEFNARTLAAADYFDPSADTVANVTAVGSVSGSVGSVTGNVGGNVVGSVGSVLGGINTAAGTIQTLDALDTAQDSQHATTQAAVADVPTVAEFNARTLAAADYFDPAADAVANVTTVGSVANLTINAGAVLATGTHNPQSGDAFARLGAPAGASVSADVAAVKADTGTLVLRITSTLFAGITSLGQWLGAMAGKQAADATAQTEIRATGAGSGTYDATTDSLEALRERGDAEWVTATGFSTFDPATDTVTLADGAHGGTAAVLTLERVIVASTTTNEPAVKLTGNGTAAGLYAIGSIGADLVGQNGPGLISRTTNEFAASTSLGSLTASLSAVAAGAISAGSFADNAISAAALAADAVAEIQNGLSTLDAAGVRAAVGLATANLDTQLAALQADLDTVTDTGVICTGLATQAKQDVNAEVLDVVSTDALVAGVTIAESLRRIGAITSGRVENANSGTETVYDWAGSANTLVFTIDLTGNRTSVTFN